MRKSVGLVLRSGSILMVAALLMMSNVFAQGGGGGEGGGSYEKLEPFTVNLAGLHQVIQVAITLKLVSLEAAPKVALYRPAIRHAVIVLLSSKTAEELETGEGKKKLITEIKAAVNKAVELSAKDGVAEVLLESIIIQ
jgi:flagellar FliL protein